MYSIFNENEIAHGAKKKMWCEIKSKGIKWSCVVESFSSIFIVSFKNVLEQSSYLISSKSNQTLSNNKNKKEKEWNKWCAYIRRVCVAVW